MAPYISVRGCVILLSNLGWIASSTCSEAATPLISSNGNARQRGGERSHFQIVVWPYPPASFLPGDKADDNLKNGLSNANTATYYLGNVLNLLKEWVTAEFFLNVCLTRRRSRNLNYAKFCLRFSQPFRNTEILSTASKQPRRSQVASELNSVISITYVTMPLACRMGQSGKMTPTTSSSIPRFRGGMSHRRAGKRMAMNHD